MPLYGAGLADVEAVSIDKSLYHGEELGIEHQAHIAALAVAMIVIADHLCTVGLEKEGQIPVPEWEWITSKEEGQIPVPGMGMGYKCYITK